MSEVSAEHTLKPIKDLTSVLWHYIYDGTHSFSLTPAQDHVISALLNQIESICDEHMPDSEMSAIKPLPQNRAVEMPAQTSGM